MLGLGKLGMGLNNSKKVLVAAPIVPPTEMSSLYGWYKADDASTLDDDDGPVGQWNDKSGNDYHLTQSTADKKPTSGVRTANSKAILDCDGGDWMLKGSLSIPIFDGNEIIISAVFQPDNTVGTHNVLGLAGTNPILTLANIGAGSAGADWEITTPATTNLQIQTLHLTATSAQLWLNGTSVGTASFSAIAADTITAFLFPSNTSGLNGGLAEILIYSDIAEQPDSDLYLKSEWGV